MDKNPGHQRSLMILIPLIIFLGGLVVCELIDPLVARNANNIAWLDEGMLQSPHLDEHDDDFVTISSLTDQHEWLASTEERTLWMPVTSCSVSPLLPPPKAAYTNL